MARAPFLDKFIGREAKDDPAAPPEERARRVERAAVVRDLTALLNTKEGYGSFLRGFGMGGYTGKSGNRDLMAALIAEIKDEIVAHEPRISEVELVPRGRDAELWMNFDLRGVIAGERRTLRIRFDTATGQVRIEEMPE